MSISVTETALPPMALLLEYQRAGAFTDCYTAEAPGAVTLAQLVQAFYCTPLFRVERVLIRLFTGIASSDAEVAALVAGTGTEFAAWRLEQLRDNQLLLCDLNARTRSWLMVAPAADSTRCYFGSAIVPEVDAATGKRRLSRGFRLLLGFHRVYSRLLLSSAMGRLAAASPKT